MSSRIILPPKAPNEIVNLSFDFTSRLAASETISSKTVTAAVYSGTDPSPGALIAGAASSSGAIVTQKVLAGTVGVIYDIDCAVTTSTGQTLHQNGYLAIVPNLA